MGGGGGLAHLRTPGMGHLQAQLCKGKATVFKLPPASQGCVSPVSRFSPGMEPFASTALGDAEFGGARVTASSRGG